MAIPILDALDLNKNELQNAVIQNLATAPSSPVPGMLYFDSTGGDATLYYYDGAAWVAAKSGAPTGAAGGDLSGTYPNPAVIDDSHAHTATTISGLDAADVTTGTFDDARIPAAIARDSEVTSAISTSESGQVRDGDTAGGDLSGTYPDPQIATGVIVNADINASAAIALSKLAVDPLARANHTGTQTASTVSDFDTQVRTNRLDQMAAPTASVSLNSQKITNLLTPTASGDAATKAYADSLANGLDWKASVRVATTAAGTLASSFENGDTVDGVVLATGDRILIKDQAAGEANGVYVVASSGAPARAEDANASAEVTGGFAVFVNEGTANGDTGWVLTTNDAITLDTTALVFAQNSGLGQVTAGGGIGKSGNTLTVAAGTGLTQDADGLSINTASTALKYAADVGDGAATSYTITHSLGTKDVHVTVFENASTFREVIVETQHTSTTAVTLVFATAPASAAYRVVVSIL